jgi:uncharacterized protein YegL
MLLVDTSWSMAENFPSFSKSKVAVAMEAVTHLLQTSNSREVAYGLIGFESVATLYEAPTAQYRNIFLKRLRPEGGTRFLPAFDLASHHKPSRVILVSDGQPQDSVEAVLAFAKRLAVPIDTIGIDDADTTLMRRIAEVTGGIYRFPTTPQEMLEVFRQLEPRAYKALADLRGV